MRRALLLLLVVAFGPAQGAETPQPTATPVATPAVDPRLDPARIRLLGPGRPMAIADVVMETFRRNLSVTTANVDLQIAREQRSAETGIYDPTLFAGAYRFFSESADEGSGSLREDGTRYNTRVEQLLPTGGRVGVGFQSQRTTTDRSGAPGGSSAPAVAQRAYVSLRQPLLKNLGRDVTNVDLRVATKEVAAREALFEQEVIDRTAAVMQAYWDLVLAVRSLEVQQASLAAALELERVIAQRVEAGSAARAELAQTRADAAGRRTRVVEAKAAVVAAQDVLLELQNWEGTATDWDRRIVPTDAPDQYDLSLAWDDEVVVSEALARRADLRAAHLGLDAAEIVRQVARWQRLPELDAVGEYGISGLDNSTRDSFDEVQEGDSTDYFYGLEFRYPIPNRRARAEYRQRIQEAEKARIGVDQLELRIRTGARAATRSARVAQESIEAADARVRAAEEALAAEQTRLAVGSATTFNVLDIQEDLAAAQVAQVKARVDYQKAIVAVHRSRGSLLDAVAAELGVGIDVVVARDARRPLPPPASPTGNTPPRR